MPKKLQNNEKKLSLLLLELKLLIEKMMRDNNSVSLKLSS